MRSTWSEGQQATSRRTQVKLGPGRGRLGLAHPSAAHRNLRASGGLRRAASRDNERSSPLNATVVVGSETIPDCADSAAGHGYEQRREEEEVHGQEVHQQIRHAHDCRGHGAAEHWAQGTKNDRRLVPSAHPHVESRRRHSPANPRAPSSRRAKDVGLVPVAAFVPSARRSRAAWGRCHDATPHRSGLQLSPEPTDEFPRRFRKPGHCRDTRRSEH